MPWHCSLISQSVQRLGTPFAWSATPLSFTWWHWWCSLGDGFVVCQFILCARHFVLALWLCLQICPPGASCWAHHRTKSTSCTICVSRPNQQGHLQQRLHGEVDNQVVMQARQVCFSEKSYFATHSSAQFRTRRCDTARPGREFVPHSERVELVDAVMFPIEGQDQISATSAPGRVPRAKMIMQVRLHAQVSCDRPIAIVKSSGTAVLGRTRAASAIKPRTKCLEHDTSWPIESKDATSLPLIDFTVQLTSLEGFVGPALPSWARESSLSLSIPFHPFAAAKESVDAVKEVLHDVLGLLPASPNDGLGGRELGTRHIAPQLTCGGDHRRTPCSKNTHIFLPKNS